MVLFEHIPKTGGSTLKRIMSRQFSHSFSIYPTEPLESFKEFERLSEAKRHKIQILQGHGASILRSKLSSPYIFTFLRDPIERMISQYRYLQTISDHRSSEASKNLSFENYLDYAIENGEDNLQTRFLSSLLEDALNQKAVAVGEKHLKEAKEQLKSFNRVLFTEYFDQSLVQLKIDLNWNHNLYYKKVNVTRGNLNLVLTDEAKEKLQKVERFDILLYKWALNSFKVNVTGKELEQFKKRNNRIQRSLPLYLIYALSDHLLRLFRS